MSDFIPYLKSLVNTGKILTLAYIIFTVFIWLLLEQDGIYFVFINLFCLLMFLGKPGQRLMTSILRGKKVTRQEDKEELEAPIRYLIDNLKSVGLDLSDDISIYIADNDQVFAYAIGRNTLLVSRQIMMLRYYNEEVFNAKIINELCRMHTYDSNNVLAILGCNFITTIIAIFALGSAYIDAKFGRKFTGLFLLGLGRNEQKDGAILFIVVSLILVIWAGISYLVIRTDVKGRIAQSDEFLLKLGKGEELCYYLDNYTKDLTGYKFKFFEMRNPSADERIGRLQSMGAAYHR